MRQKILWAVLLLATCTGVGFTQKAIPPAANAPAELQSLVEYEREFARTAAAKGMRTAFLAFIADDCVLFRPDPVNGKTWWSERPDSPGLLSWEPVYADVSQSGDLGYTTGPFEFRPKGRDDKPTNTGYYMSIWRKQANGSWKFVIDQGTPTPAHKAWPAAVAFPGSLGQSAFRDQPGRNADQVHEELFKLERSFSQASSKNTLEAFVSHAADNIRIMRSGSFPAVGVAAMRSVFEAAPCALTWAPMFAASSRAGDLGYAYGTYECRPAGQPGKPADPEKGIYVRIWKRLPDGDWRVVLDLLSPWLRTNALTIPEIAELRGGCCNFN